MQCENQPNKKGRHLPDNYSKAEVFKIYMASLDADREDGHASFSSFHRVWGKSFPEVKIPAVNRFSQCSHCRYYKTLRDKGPSLMDKRML